jgi:RIO kinase 1
VLIGVYTETILNEIDLSLTQERKKEAKEAARERRKTKMPKAEKKRRMRNSHK